MILHDPASHSFLKVFTVFRKIKIQSSSGGHILEIAGSWNGMHVENDHVDVSSW